MQVNFTYKTLTLIKAVLIPKSFANTCMLVCIFNTISILFIWQIDVDIPKISEVQRNWSIQFCCCYKWTGLMSCPWAKHAHRHRHTFLLAQAVDEAVGTGSHLQWLAAVINDVALNFGDRHFWEPLFTLHWSIIGAFEGSKRRGQRLPSVWCFERRRN